jgi:hypothetical protein
MKKLATGFCHCVGFPFFSCLSSLNTNTKTHLLLLILLSKMNQAQVIAQLNQQAAVISAYLGQTNRGAISVRMRHGAIYALTGFPVVLQREQGINNNLQNQLNAALLRIAHLNHQLNKITTDTAEAAKDLIESKKFDAVMKEIDEERQKMDVVYMERMTADLKAAEEKLAAALKDANDAKLAKQNANRLLNQVLDFVETQQFAVVGYMQVEKNIVGFDFELVRQLAAALRADMDLDLNLDTNTMVDMLAAITIQMDQTALAATDNDTQVEVTTPHNQVDEVDE